MISTIPVITIDGPSGSGKGTIARRLAEHLQWHLLDSGVLYRLLGLVAQRRGVLMEDVEALTSLARDLPVEFVVNDLGVHGIVVDGEDVCSLIRTEEYGNAASKVASIAQVRQALLDRQRAFRLRPGLVADGRDMGTVVFPDASVKIYLTASVEERAQRRYKQLNEQGLGGNLSGLLREIAERDERDASRSVAPLKPAEDAEVIDTTGISVEAVLEHVLEVVTNRLGPSTLGKSEA